MEYIFLVIYEYFSIIKFKCTHFVQLSFDSQNVVYSYNSYGKGLAMMMKVELLNQ